MKTSKSDRRQDSVLRSAIDRIRQDADRLTNSCKIYQETLKELCQITGSPEGFVIEASTEDQFPKLLVTHPVATKTKALDLPYEFKEGIGRLSTLLSSAKPEIFNHPDKSIIDLSFLDLPPIKRMIAIPLIDHDNFYAIICLTNSRLPYEISIVSRCKPLLATSARMQRTLGFKQLSTPNESKWCKTLEDLFQNSQMPMICIDGEQKILRMNIAAEESFLTTLSSSREKLVTEFVYDNMSDGVRSIPLNPNHIDTSTPRRLSLTGRQSLGRTFPILVTSISYQIEQQPEKAALLMIDVSPTHQSLDRQQHDQAQRFQAVSDLAPIGILQSNATWEAEYVNNRWCDICGHDRNEILGLGWINSIHPDEVTRFLESLRETLFSGNEFNGECRFMTPIGNTVWVQFQARPLIDQQGVSCGFSATLLDTTYRKITEEKLKKLAEHDSLTGLSNRPMFHQRLEHALDRMERQGPFALLCLDLDGFKNINDTLGHDSGDLLLIEIAKRLVDCVRSEDTVARLGGDEFMILIEGLPDSSVAANVAEKILSSLEQPTIIGNQEIFISTSIGITFATGQGKCDAKNLIKQADIALYRAKEDGRNNYQYFSPELEEASKARLLLGNSLYRAMKQSEFEVFYQIQAKVSNNQPVGTEALLRWQHPDKGLLAPTAFIPLLEESGLIGPVSRWLWKQAFTDHKRWVDQGLLPEDSHVSINLSPRQLRDSQLIISLESAMAEAGIVSSQVVVELTESSLIADSNTTSQTLRNIKNLGVRLALDDFGTGYSSLTYLKRFSIDIIKIDRTFVQDILTDTDDVAIIQALLALSKSLSITTVAEGVDAAEKLNMLAKWGCELHQGYLLNKPCGSKKLEALLQSACEAGQ